MATAPIISASTEFQPAQTYDISRVIINGQIKQPSPGSTANFQFKVYGTVYKESSQSSTSQIKVSLTVADTSVDSAAHKSRIVTIASFTTASKTFDSGWIDSGLSHRNANDNFTFEFSCQGCSDSPKSYNKTGNLYWTQSSGGGGGGGSTTYYTITYNANGGSSTPASQTFVAGTRVTLRGAISRSGYTFTGWNTAANGSGTSYQAGGSYVFGWNWTMYAQWKKIDSGSTTPTVDNSLVVYCTNANDVCYASTSDIDGTSATENNGTRSVKLQCKQGSTYYKAVKIEYMPDASGTRYPNSFCLKIYWGSSATNIVAENSVIFSPATAAKGAKWTDHALSTRILDENTTWDHTPAQIDVTASSSGTTSNGTITELTLNDYYIANKGLTTGTSDTTVGSYNNPAKWYNRYSNATSSSISTEIGTPKAYKKLSWKKPSTGTPLYYIILLWKGYSTSYVFGTLGGSLTVNGAATSCIMTYPFWQNGFNSGYQIKFTVHAVYSDGINPTFKTGHDQAQNNATYGMGKSAVETHSIWWEMTYPPTSTTYRIRFYEQDKTTLLKDSSGNDYDYYVPSGAAIQAPTDVKVSGVENTEAYNITGWYKKSGSGSWGSSAVTSLGTANADLSFAQVVTKKTYTVTYPNTSGTTSTVVIDHGDAITVDNADGTNPAAKAITSNYTIPTPTKSGFIFKGYEYDETNRTFFANWLSDKYVYIYDTNSSSWKRYKTYIYNGSAWKRSTYFVYNSEDEGWY